MNLKHLSDQELDAKVGNFISEERERLAYLLHHLREVERRRLYSPKRSVPGALWTRSKKTKSLNSSRINRPAPRRKSFVPSIQR